MGMDVDEARRHELAARIDLLGAAASHFADGDDDAAGDTHVALEGRVSSAVDDGAAADDEVQLARHASALSMCPAILMAFLRRRPPLLGHRKPDKRTDGKARI